MRTLSLGPEFNEKLVKLHFDTESYLPLPQLKKDVKSTHQITSPKDGGNSVGHRTDNLISGEMMGSISRRGSTEKTDAKLNNELPVSQVIQTLSMKVYNSSGWLALLLIEVTAICSVNGLLTNNSFYCGGVMEITSWSFDAYFQELRSWLLLSSALISHMFSGCR